MFTLFAPSEIEIADYLAAQKDLPFSYSEIGASRDKIPSGYPINHRRRELGSGAETFNRAKNALDDWTMYQLGWTHLHPAKIPISVGETVCVVVDHGFCWSANPCRIVYVFDEGDGALQRYGFAFGTLPGHSEEGEERFTVEWNHADDSVWYEILSFARPHHLFARIGFPFVKLFQHKFAVDSADAMFRAVNNQQS
jgi:uncharacterized protein (UPF0548 family)